MLTRMGRAYRLYRYSPMMKINFAAFFLFTAVATVTGCASLPQQQGLSNVHTLVEQHSGTNLTWADTKTDDAKTDELVEELLKQPLTPDTAVQMALLRNPRMQAEYARLGIAHADVYEASRLSNPTLSITALNPHEAGAAKKLDVSLSQSFADLLLLPSRKRLALGEYERTQQSIAAEILNLTAEVHAAWYSYVGAQQIAAMREMVAQAAQTSAELARQFHTAGNISKLQLQLEEASATQARLEATRANAETTRARFALQQLLGSSIESTQWTTPTRLPVPLAEDEDQETLVSFAHEQRLDLAAAKKEVTLLEQSLGLTKRYRWLGQVEVGVAMERETDRTKLYGPSLSLQLPIFNQGKGSVMRAHALLDQSRARLQLLEREIDNQVRSGIEHIKITRKIVEDYRNALIPQREAVVAHTQENVNFMLMGVFELLLAKQQEYDAYQGYIEAVRDYWLARVELMRAVGKRLPNDTNATEPTLSPEDLVRPPSGEGSQHKEHQHQDMPQPDKNSSETSLPEHEHLQDAHSAEAHSSHQHAEDQTSPQTQEQHSHGDVK